MKQNIVRLVILGVLIVLCIWQTVMLWLGDMSGHNFFTHNVASYEISYVHPKQVWCSIRGKIKGSAKESANSGIYKLESNSEKEDLMEELVKELRKGNLNIDLSPKEKYEELLKGSAGIIYEFGTELTIEEIIGQPLTMRGKKYQAVKIKEIYVDLSASDAYKTYVYLIDEEANTRQKITIDSPLRYGLEVVNLYTDKENVGSHQVYQASINSISDKEFFVGNAFYPQSTSTAFIQGNKIGFRPIIEDMQGQELENYVNYLFKNPSYKIASLIETGIVFTDNLNITVTYNAVGTLEFQKTLINDNEKLSRLEKLNKINHFVKESRAIPQSLKEGLYLENIYENSDTGETMYQFGYRYEDGNVVVLSDTVKSQLGVNSFLELGIKNSEVISGKWIMLEFQEIGAAVHISMGSSEAINEIYENSGLTEIDEFKLDDLDCTYWIKEPEKESEFGWLGFYKEQPIHTAEKIDNE